MGPALGVACRTWALNPVSLLIEKSAEVNAPGGALGSALYRFIAESLIGSDTSLTKVQTSMLEPRMALRWA